MTDRHPLIGRRVTHKDGTRARVLAAQIDAQGFYRLLLEVESGRMVESGAEFWTLVRPSIRPRAEET